MRTTSRLMALFFLLSAVGVALGRRWLSQGLGGLRAGVAVSPAMQIAVPLTVDIGLGTSGVAALAGCAPSATGSG